MFLEFSAYSWAIYKKRVLNWFDYFDDAIMYHPWFKDDLGLKINE